MAVNLSPIWGAGAQLLDNSGNVLSGGKIYTYAAGTTTPATTYTSSNGLTANSNPIILNSAGRVPYEIWLTDGISYKFVLKDSNDTLIATYDNLSGINSNFIAYTAQQEIQTATAGQTVFTLATMQYQPGTNSLSVYVDGVNQYGPGAMYAYVETDSSTVTFVSGLHVGASVKFTTASPVSSSSTDALNVSYTPPFTGSVGTNVQAKLAQTVSVQDFGAVGDGITDDTTAIQNAIDASDEIIFPSNATYMVTSLDVSSDKVLKIDGVVKSINANDDIFTNSATISNVTITGTGTIDGNKTAGSGTSRAIFFSNASGISNIKVDGITVKDCYTDGISIYDVTNVVITNCKVSNSNANNIKVEAFNTDVSNVVITNNTTDTTSSQNGIFVVGSSGNTVSGVIVSNNLVLNSADIGIEVGTYTQDASVTGNTIVGLSSSGSSTGVLLRGCNRVSCVGNNVTNCGVGIYGWTNAGDPVASDLEINGNTVRNCLYSSFKGGIAASGVSRINITGNTSRQNYWGIYLAKCEDAKVNSNNCSLNQKSGIVIEDVNRFTVQSNMSFDNDASTAGGSASAGIYLTKNSTLCQYGIVTGNHCYNSSGAQAYGISYANVYYTQITDNYLASNGTSALNSIGTNTSTWLSRNQTTNQLQVMHYPTSLGAQTIANGARYTFAVSVAGAELGDSAVAYADQSVFGGTVTAYVNASTDVRVQIYNGTGGSITIPAANWYINVYKNTYA